MNLNKRKNKGKNDDTSPFWNCRGLKKKGVSTFLKNLILEYKFHFFWASRDYDS